MAAKIEDYAVIGNGETAALVCRDGSVDWLCMPRFDSAACFAALLGDESNGRWRIAPSGAHRSHRAYRGKTLILETFYETDGGSAKLIDFMAREEGRSYLCRRVEGISGTIEMNAALCVRFDYGASIPWVTQLGDGRLKFVVGPDQLVLQSSIRPADGAIRDQLHFTVKQGEIMDFALGWTLSYRDEPPPVDLQAALAETEDFWTGWAARFPGAGKYSDEVQRSLITLKSLAHFETGGIVAAVTTSLPEQLGGERNWDYRFCWLRDATLTLYALLESNYVEEAKRWRHWLSRAIAGSAEQLQIMYRLDGARRLDEYELDWLPGYENSKPVRIGNAASGQVQLDIYGEVLDALYFARKQNLPQEEGVWNLVLELLERLAKIWDQPDDGIWEMRGGRRHFTHSKVMAWVAFDRAVRLVEDYGHEGPVGEWRRIRKAIHEEVCAKGFDKSRNCFVQYYGAKEVDASLLLIALTGFLPADDPRVAGTVKAIEEDLLSEGFVLRYRTEAGTDGLSGNEGAFLACSFWLVDNYVLLGRFQEAEELFEKLLSLRNDLGLLAEEYDARAKRQVGNFPQAFSHIGLINSAYNLTRANGPAAKRADGDGAAAPVTSSEAV
ncbi:glycoside hydrolase family 15 protein [Acidocella sp. MX-AZ02]|uniref:glycoside hydrolase family 15 protein n=2 Tax=unclassified Acidocella TaxID=2648610 RepID=UPI00028F0F5E|nr:glycoside hydrolase family 15 protein [Acidocella sp. MX-AZ02]EKM98298.1 glycoside hydrolase 15-like protein [Acidocella sp. MX-AZ02]